MTAEGLRDLEILPLEKDKVNCGTCSLSLGCGAYRPGRECALTDDNKSVAWADNFASGSVGDLDTAIQRILQVQASRVQKMIDSKFPDEATPAEKLRYEQHVDRNLQKLFANAMAYRAAKAPRPAAARGGKVIDQNGEFDLPDKASPQMIAEALTDLEKMGFDRRALTRRDAIEHLAEKGMIALPAGHDEEPI